MIRWESSARIPQNDSANPRGNDASSDIDDYPAILAKCRDTAQPAKSDGDGADDGEALNVENLDSKAAQCDEFSHLLWLEPMEIVVTIGGSPPDRCRDCAGFCGAKLTRRKKIRGSFYTQMSKPFEELTLLAFALFDRFGMLRLKDNHKDHATRKGLCTWETRLGYGDVLLIQDVIVEKPYPRLGPGKKIIRGLLEVT
ncbi:uncharacterized protein A1O5_13236 [Cladophialophora psammophila CBS 110553]|uniref:Uncharacterized protein n=1 Tax=Cladophialophora psammophila CBS 110553 TaxID=1182543 RepID=W9W4Q7_9EURO|nr:uncharacterized protein A1O5_13236 [Cladophialophora psammophila CBS 110553]EXJ53564.1 hypothetical protein A1O5_13236 [Cladophialophora psammophila CBS 110553]